MAAMRHPNRGELTVNMAEIASGRHVNGISLRFLGLCKGGQDVWLKPFWAAGVGGLAAGGRADQAP